MAGRNSCGAERIQQPEGPSSALCFLPRFAEQQLRKVVQIALPYFEIVLAAGNDMVHMRHLFVVEQFALDALVSRPLVTTRTLILFVCNQLFNFNRNIRPHCFLEAGHVTEELLLGLFWRGRPPIADKDNCARVNRGLANRLAAEATLVSVLECCHEFDYCLITNSRQCRFSTARKFSFPRR